MGNVVRIGKVSCHRARHIDVVGISPLLGECRPGCWTGAVLLSDHNLVFTLDEPARIRFREDMRLSTHGQLSNVRTFSNVFRPITNTSTLARNSSYPCGSPPPSGRKSKSPLRRAMKPSTLVP